MKHLGILIAVLFSSSVFAKRVELKVSTTYKSGDVIKKMKNVKIVANLDKEFVIPSTKGNPFRMKLNVSEFNKKISDKLDPKKSVMVQGNISTLIDGKMKNIATPQLITMFGREAIITIGDDDGSHFEMKILPVKTEE